MSAGEVADIGAEDDVAAERPAWLPENFTSPEALATSYGEAQRKITEMGNELKDLRSIVESLGSEEDETELPDDGEQYGWDEPSRYDRLDHMARLAEQAQGIEDPRQYLSRDEQLAAISQATTRQVDETYGRSPGQMAPGDVAQAGVTMAQTILGDGFDSQRASQVIAADPDLRARGEQALNTGDLGSWATVLLDASSENHPLVLSARKEVLDQRSASLDERAKLQAQTASGQGPSRSAPSDSQVEWAAIREAGHSSPWTGSRP